MIEPHHPRKRRGRFEVFDNSKKPRFYASFPGEDPQDVLYGLKTGALTQNTRMLFVECHSPTAEKIRAWCARQGLRNATVVDERLENLDLSQYPPITHNFWDGCGFPSKALLLAYNKHANRYTERFTCTFQIGGLYDTNHMGSFTAKNPVLRALGVTDIPVERVEVYNRYLGPGTNRSPRTAAVVKSAWAHDQLMTERMVTTAQLLAYALGAPFVDVCHNYIKGRFRFAVISLDLGSCTSRKPEEHTEGLQKFFDSRYEARKNTVVRRCIEGRVVEMPLFAWNGSALNPNRQKYLTEKAYDNRWSKFAQDPETGIYVYQPS